MLTLFVTPLQCFKPLDLCFHLQQNTFKLNHTYKMRGHENTAVYAQAFVNFMCFLYSQWESAQGKREDGAANKNLIILFCNSIIYRPFIVIYAINKFTIF